MAAESFLAQALSTLIADFNRRDLKYALAGGWAYSALVEPRATTDIALLVLLDQPSREAIRSLLSSQFDAADSEYLREALARRRIVSFGSLQVPILALEDLILLKTLAGRLQDQADLEKIRARQNELGVDWAYVEAWKATLGLP